MDYTYLYDPYENLLKMADEVFNRIQKQYPEFVNCKPGCADCCHALFGLFIIEAVFLKHHFENLEDELKKEALSRAERAEEEARSLDNKIRGLGKDQEKINQLLATERIRCPLLNDNNQCILYPFRPITCRVYGIPVAIHGKSHVCPKATFEKDGEFPFFNLDAAYKELHSLSKELLKRLEKRDISDASLLLTIPYVLKTPLDDLLYKDLKSIQDQT